jgi:hypothetical protein
MEAAGRRIGSALAVYAETPRVLGLAWRAHPGYALSALLLHAAGWALARCGVPDPARLLVGYVVATRWLLAAALPGAQAHLASRAVRAARRPGRPPARAGQLRLPLPLACPWIATFSLLPLGRRAFRRTPCRIATPALCWRFPDWHAPVWSAQCLDVYHARTA